MKSLTQTKKSTQKEKTKGKERKINSPVFQTTNSVTHYFSESARVLQHIKQAMASIKKKHTHTQIQMICEDANYTQNIFP